MANGIFIFELKQKIQNMLCVYSMDTANLINKLNNTHWNEYNNVHEFIIYVYRIFLIATLRVFN